MEILVMYCFMMDSVFFMFMKMVFEKIRVLKMI